MSHPVQWQSCHKSSLSCLTPWRRACDANPVSPRAKILPLEVLPAWPATQKCSHFLLPQRCKLKNASARNSPQAASWIHGYRTLSFWFIKYRGSNILLRQCKLHYCQLNHQYLFSPLFYPPADRAFLQAACSLISIIMFTVLTEQKEKNYDSDIITVLVQCIIFFRLCYKTKMIMIFYYNIASLCITWGFLDLITKRYQMVCGCDWDFSQIAVVVRQAAASRLLGKKGKPASKVISQLKWFSTPLPPPLCSHYKVLGSPFSATWKWGVARSQRIHWESDQSKTENMSDISLVSVLSSWLKAFITLVWWGIFAFLGLIWCPFIPLVAAHFYLLINRMLWMFWKRKPSPQKDPPLPHILITD